MTQLDLFPTVTSSPQDIHVNPSQLPGSVKARRMTATSGRTLCKLLHTKDPLGAFSRMLVVTSHWVSTRCYLTWKPKTTPQGRLLLELAVSMPRTDDLGSGLWLTPTVVQTDEHPDNMKKRMEKYPNGTTVGSLTSQVKYAPLWPTPTASDYKGRGPNSKQQGLPEKAKMWPTPTASMARSEGSINQMRKKVYAGEVTQQEAEAMIGGSLEPSRMKPMWPTPTARDHKGMSGKGRQQKKGNPKDTLPNALGGQLNPTWVEWLMGYPRGWTELKD